MVVSSSVPQEELALVAALTQQIDRLLLTRNQHCQRIAERLLEGAGVDPGRHTAEIVRIPRGPSCVFQLVVDGRRIR